MINPCTPEYNTRLLNSKHGRGTVETHYKIIVGVDKMKLRLILRVIYNVLKYI